MTSTIATRQSPLALWQTQHVADQLEKFGIDTRQLPLSTRGDEKLDRSLADIGGKGLFLKELEEAMLAGKADLAVHSCKDVPVDLDSRFAIAAVLTAATPWDAFVSNRYETLNSMPEGSVVGTASPRRELQLKYLRPDLQVALVRGNVQTRLQKLDNGEYDALLLACAGLERLDLDARIRQILQPPNWLPAPGQGVIVIETLSDNHRVIEQLQVLHDPAQARLTLAERQVSAALQGDCHTPLGVFASEEAGEIHIQAVLGEDVDHQQPVRLVRDSICGPADQSTELAEQLAHTLAEQLAQRLQPQQ